MMDASGLIFAALGDLHGHLDAGIQLLQEVERRLKLRISFVLQTGDFEAHRYTSDLESMYAPFRHKQMGDFHAYHDGLKHVPWSMYFIGGNHEPYGFLDAFPGGIEIARNVHYLGRAGCKQIEGLHVAYLTGCFDERVLKITTEERASRDALFPKPYPYALARYLQSEVDALMVAPFRPDVLLIHEWPFGIVRPEDHEDGEPHHRRLRYNETGVVMNRTLVETLSPQLVICGHMHRTYRSVIPNQYAHFSQVVCLSSVTVPDGAFALFTVSNGVVHELHIN